MYRIVRHLRVAKRRDYAVVIQSIPMRSAHFTDRSSSQISRQWRAARKRVVDELRLFPELFGARLNRRELLHHVLVQHDVCSRCIPIRRAALNGDVLDRCRPD